MGSLSPVRLRAQRDIKKRQQNLFTDTDPDEHYRGWTIFTCDLGPNLQRERAKRELRECFASAQAWHCAVTPRRKSFRMRDTQMQETVGGHDGITAGLEPRPMLTLYKHTTSG